MQRVAVLGATGSIGTSALDVLSRYPEDFCVYALAAGTRIEKLVGLAARFHPEVVGIADQEKVKALKDLLAARGLQSIRVVAGAKDVASLAAESRVDTVLQAVVGAAGLAPSFEAARAGKRLLLANKESVVCGASLLMETVKKGGATLLPIDSEHNAIFQCLHGASRDERKAARIWLTCSGGPFRDKKDLDLSKVTPEVALSHPTWSMGKKISIDSATLMNKGFEVIEARYLFDVPSERIRVVVHPQSVLHSMVEFSDGSVIGQMGPTDMRLAIAYCLGYPKRLVGTDVRLDFTQLGPLTFEAPDTARFPLLTHAYDALRAGGLATVVLNAANEMAVGAFLNRAIRFTDIAWVCETMLRKVSGSAPTSLEEILETDAAVRAQSAEEIARLSRL